MVLKIVHDVSVYKSFHYFHFLRSVSQPLSMKPVALTQKVKELVVCPRYGWSLELLTRSKRGMSVKHLQEAITLSIHMSVGQPSMLQKFC